MKPDTSKLFDELNKKIGRNLLRYQYIELFLKQIIPYVHSENKTHSYVSDEFFDIESLRKYQDYVQSQTFGNLILEFKKFNEIPDGFFDQALEKTKDERNRLVHNFLEIPEVEYLSTQNGLIFSIKYLDDKFNEAYELYEFLRCHSLMLLIAKLESAAEDNMEAKAQFDQIMNLVPDYVEIICPDNPARTEWSTTRIVKLLQRAESETLETQGMTLLSRAGMLIKDAAPDLSPKDYGFKSLKEIVLASGLFEILVQKNETGRSVILYKSKS